MNHRLLEVDVARLPRWVTGFGERHGDVVVEVTGEVGAGAVRLSAADGAVAVLEALFPGAVGTTDPVADVARQAGQDRRAAFLLVRRGGWAVGVAEGVELTRHKVGTKYVQGRTAAGGWSQQRFARRRAGQAAGLVGAAAEAAHHAWAGERPQVLVVGGDRQLVEDVLADPRLARVGGLPRSPVLDVRDPRLDVLRETVRRSRSVRVRLDEPD